LSQAEKEPRKEELGEEAKRQVKSEKGAEVVQRQTAAGMQQNNTKVLAVDDSDSNILEAPQCSQKSNYVGKVILGHKTIFFIVNVICACACVRVH